MGNTCAGSAFDDVLTETTIGSVRSYFERKNRHISESGKVNLLSYNIFMRPPGINNNGNDYKDDRLADFIKVLPKYDIICLQEMFGSYSGRRSEIIERAADAGFLFHCVSPNPNMLSQQFIDGGLLILSRFPIVASDFCPYSEGIGADFYVLKGALYAKIKIGHSNLHLYTTHAQATYDGSLKYILKRHQQFTCFQQFIQRTLSEKNYQNNDIVLLTGDFNVDGRDDKKLNVQQLPEFKKYESLTASQLFSEYDVLTACLSDDNKNEVTNLLLKSNGENPVTFGDCEITANGEKKPRETVLTDKECLLVDECLDYIFQYTPKALRESRIESPTRFVKERLDIMQGTGAVEKFLIEGRKYTQLSDHYGVQISLRYSEAYSGDQEEAETTLSDDDLGSPINFVSLFKAMEP